MIDLDSAHFFEYDNAHVQWPYSLALRWMYGATSQAPVILPDAMLRHTALQEMQQWFIELRVASLYLLRGEQRSFH